MFSKGICPPKMEWLFWLRIYNQLPRSYHRKMWTWWATRALLATIKKWVGIFPLDGGGWTKGSGHEIAHQNALQDFSVEQCEKAEFDGRFWCKHPMIFWAFKKAQDAQWQMKGLYRLGFLQGGPRIPVISRDLETPVTNLFSAMYTQCTTDKSPPCWFLYVPSFCEANTGIIYDLCGRWSKGIIWGLHQLKILWLTKSSNMTLSGVFFLKYFFFAPRNVGMISNLTFAYFSDGLKLNHQPDDCSRTQNFCWMCQAETSENIFSNNPDVPLGRGH